MIRAAALAGVTVAADQVTKVGYDDPVNAAAPFTEGHGSQSPVLVGVALALTAAVAYLLRRPWWAAGLALGGIVSNLFDRAVHGGVRDPIAYGPYWWNLADLAAAVGLGVCVGRFAFDTRREVETWTG